MQRPPLRALRAQRARSEAAGVAHCPSDVRVSRWPRHKCMLAVHGTRRRGLALLGRLPTPVAEGLASGASKVRARFKLSNKFSSAQDKAARSGFT